MCIRDSTTTTTRQTYYYVRKDRMKFPVGITATSFTLNNQLTGTIIVFRDITHEIEIDKAKIEFISLASHELRTPLTAIDGLVSMIRDGEYGEVGKDLRQPLEDINTSSERLIHLVNDLLNLSRIQAGRLKYTLSEFSIADVIIKTVHLLQPLSQEKGLHLTTTKLEYVTV